MKDYRSLSHTKSVSSVVGFIKGKGSCKYHVVFIPTDENVSSES